jgi:hypothetical protein
MNRPARKKVAWEHLSDDDLLDVRIGDLGVKLKGSPLEARVVQLFRELEQAELGLRPKIFVSDEWLSPADQGAIGVPFFLLHPRLRALESRMMFEVEGGSPAWCMKLLRHEAGHAFDHAYGLSRRKDWKEIFGSPSRPYQPYFYEIDPESRAFVHNVPDHYAQAHPSEDFAETFAVWLDPRSDWRERYKGRPALRKLRYVDRLMREVRARRVPRRRWVVGPEARTLTSPLRRYYERKFRLYKLLDLSFAVRDMKTIFRVSRAAEPKDTAAEFIRARKKRLVQSIAGFSGERESQVARVVASLAQLSDQHRLVVRGEEEEALLKFSAYATTLIVNRLLKHTYRATKP